MSTMTLLPVIHLSISVTGKVHGVRYRWSTREVAKRLGLTGNVKNLADGSVRIEVEGHRTDLNALVAWCRQGPPKADVNNLNVEEGSIEGYQDFTIIR